jgi:HlyD family secretion protein
LAAGHYLDIGVGCGHSDAVDTTSNLKSSAATPRPKRLRRRKLWLWASASVMVLGATASWYSVNRDAAVPVVTEKILRRTLTETVVANGKIYPVLQVHISPEVSGEIIELAVKEGQAVHKGDLLLRIKPDYYVAAVNQAKASYESSLAGKATAAANLERAEADFKRNQELFHRNLLSESDYISYKVACDVARAQLESAGHQVEVAKAAVDSAQDSLDKTTIVAPLDGTVTTLNSQVGERVLGTVQNAGTDIMIISDLSSMEARVDIGEMDIVLLHPGEQASLEVDSFKAKKFSGVVTDVANSSESMNASSVLGGAASSATSGQTATQFQVRIRLTEKAAFRPGMSVTAKVETRTRSNILTAPISSVTSRVLKKSETNSVSGPAPSDDKTASREKPVEVVFVVQENRVKTVPVTIGISDDNFWEIINGVREGDEIVTGNYRAVSRDLDDGKRIKRVDASSLLEKSKS